MKLAALSSGGKDGNLALYLMECQGFTISCILTMIPHRSDSWMFHVPNVKWVRLQARAMGIPLIIQHTEGEKGSEISDLEKLMRKAILEYRVDGVVFGAISSEYQRFNLERLCDALGLKSYAPLWGKDPLLLIEDLLKLGFKVLIVGVYALGLRKEHLGRLLDQDMLRVLKRLKDKYDVNPAGEGGELETFVLDAPHFSHSIEICAHEIRWYGDYGELIIRDAKLKPKVRELV
ncbi:MAG: diphthine--ammonia ligase [Thermoprotei archaeon]|nr:diphthine--ammonia ligase [Thermoprotei archaeon]